MPLTAPRYHAPTLDRSGSRGERRLVALVGIEAASRDDLTGGAAAAPVFARLLTRLR